MRYLLSNPPSALVMALALPFSLSSSNLPIEQDTHQTAYRLESPAGISFEERVAAQRSIEEVYWRHRIWPKGNPQPKPPLSTVMPDDAIRAKVDDYLKKSNALEKWWQRPITAEQLQSEMDRMARQTHDPQVLQELFAAVGNSPFVIAETLRGRHWPRA